MSMSALTESCVRAENVAAHISAPKWNSNRKLSLSVQQTKFWTNNVTNLYLFIFSFQMVSHPDVVHGLYTTLSVVRNILRLFVANELRHKRCQQNKTHFGKIKRAKVHVHSRDGCLWTTVKWTVESNEPMNESRAPWSILLKQMKTMMGSTDPKWVHSYIAYMYIYVIFFSDSIRN